ncbi:MAG: trypsin-like serine protease [Bacteroidales bacterium]|nr:trypsin-like serine protease [Bacteroidales bacterium]
MKKFLFFFFLYMVPFSAMSQKVNMQVIKVGNVAESEWQILDEQYLPVFSGNEYFRDDSVSFSLEANKRYFLQISVSEVTVTDTNLYSLVLNGEPILLVNSETGPGDYFFPFFTGIKTEPSKITGGADASISDFPWQVYYESGNYLCGGSIISKNWIVTAAHCTKNDNGSAISASEMDIKVGASNPVYGKKYYVSQVIVHENYNNETLENDIALLKLQEPINYENAKPIDLISAEDVANGATDPGVMSWVTGWGLTKVSPKVLPSVLQKVQLPIVSNTQAAKVWDDIPETDIMAGYLNGNKDACSGDSGGPLVVPVSGGYKLAGIVSWGSSNCNTYGAYTRVSSFGKWIEGKITYTPPSPAGDTIVCQGAESSLYSIDEISGASVYEWQLSPDNAGVIAGNSENAVVSWNLSYTGPAVVKLRVTVNDTVSGWSELNVKLAKNTKLLSQSDDTVLCAENQVSLKVEAEGYNLLYRWFHNGDVIQSGKSAGMNIVRAYTGDSGDYLCEISGSCGTVSSGNMNLTVYPLTRISYISPDITVDFGDDATLEVSSEGHDLVYQWQKDGEMIDNSNVSQLVLKDADANDIGLYRTIVTGTCGTETSDTVYVYISRENKSEEREVFVWPTITVDDFNVALSKEEYYNIRIFSTLGQLVKEKTKCRYQTTVNISNLTRGLYIVNVYNDKFRKSIKLIKE